MPGKLLYRTFSWHRTIKSTLFRLFALSGALFAIWHYKENPVVTSALFILGLLLFLTAGDDEILIYDDRIKISGGSIWNSLRGMNTHQYSEVNSIKVSGTMGFKDEVKEDLVEVMPGPFFATKGRNQLTVTRSDGKTITFQLSIYRTDIDVALNKIPEPFNTLVTKA